MPTAESTVTVHRDVPYREVAGETLRLDIYEPTDRKGPLPVAVLVRGGGFVIGDKGEFARHAIDFASDGFLAIEPQYRLAPEWPFPAALSDVRAAVEWVRDEGKQYDADPDRLAGVGHSAGANLVALAAATANGAEEADASPLAAVVGYSGIYDFRAFDTAEFDPDEPDIHAQYLGGTIKEVPETYERASPAARIDDSTPPTLLLHGADDDVLPAAQSEQFADALAPVTDVEFDELPTDHGLPFHGATYDRVYERTRTFLHEHGLDG
ncbi:alpha/beta fold hydrolase [Natronoarchaeum sp. GCM10025703]|uniref:alpha/beta fold hydrolase n=1 Tax=unclassified Natronoarchaeum TaxID=2620183 RepID=UPI003609702E